MQFSFNYIKNILMNSFNLFLEDTMNTVISKNEGTKNSATAQHHMKFY